MHTTPSTTDATPGTRRVLATVALAVLLALAGCQTGETPTAGAETPATPTPSAVGPGEEGPEPSPVPDWPATETPEAGPLEGLSLPPGVDEEGAVNGTRLLAAHRERRPDPPYRVRVDPVGSAVEPETTLVLTRGERRVRLRRATQTGTTAYWASGERRVVGVNREPGVTYAKGRTAERDRLLALSTRARTAVVPYLLAGDLEAVGAVEIHGTQLVKLAVDGVDAEALAESPYRPAGDGARVLDAQGTLLVSQQGVVQRARLEVTYDTGDGTVSETFRYALGAVDEPGLAAPEWLAEAPRIAATAGDRGTVLVLENGGETPLPAGTEVTVTGEGEVLGTLTLEQPLDPGGVRYVTARWDDEDATMTVAIHDDRPETTRQHVDFRRYDTVAVAGTTEAGRFSVGVRFPEAPADEGA